MLTSSAKNRNQTPQAIKILVLLFTVVSSQLPSYDFDVTAEQVLETMGSITPTYLEPTTTTTTEEEDQKPSQPLKPIID